MFGYLDQRELWLVLLFRLGSSLRCPGFSLCLIAFRCLIAKQTSDEEESEEEVELSVSFRDLLPEQQQELGQPPAPPDMTVSFGGVSQCCLDVFIRVSLLWWLRFLDLLRCTVYFVVSFLNCV